MTKSPHTDRHVVHAADQTFHSFSEGQNFGAQVARLGAQAGGHSLKTSLHVIEPGRRAYPHHAHHGIEEALYVLEGHGTLRFGDDEGPVEAGCYVAFLPGGPAHQLINTSSAPLRYLCISAGTGADIVTYPDTGKVAATAGDWSTMSFSHRALYWDRDHPGYYDGEDVGPQAD